LRVSVVPGILARSPRGPFTQSITEGRPNMRLTILACVSFLALVLVPIAAAGGPAWP
jgi:hypothetical protein